MRRKKSDDSSSNSARQNKPCCEIYETITSEIGHHFSSLFRPLANTPRDRRVVRYNYRLQKEKQYDGTYLKYDEIEYEFRCFEELGDDDLRIFLRLVSIAGVDQIILDPFTEQYEGDDGRILEQLNIITTISAVTEKKRLCSTVRSKPVSLNKVFSGYLGKGRMSGRHVELFKKSLARLASTTVFVRLKRNGKVMCELASTLLSYSFDEFRRFIVAINPVATCATLGRPLGGYAPVIDGRVLNFSGVLAVLLSWLSAWILPGRKGTISLERLEQHIYGNVAEDRRTRHSRRQQLKKALKKIDELEGWCVQEVHSGVFNIERSESIQKRANLLL